MLPRRCLRLSFLISAIACSSATAPVPEIEGAWGGDQANLTLSQAGGVIQYQCGGGTINPGWTLAAGGQFSGVGDHFFGGGPVPAEGPPAEPAVYAGQLMGSVLTLTVTLTDLDQTLGPFRLVRGGPNLTNLCY